LVFIKKKKNQIEIFFLKKTKPGQTEWFRFGSVFRAKTGSNRFGLIFPVLARFFPGLAWFWLGFFYFSSFGSV